MALNGNGTSQYLSLGTATVVSRNIPLTVMALVDSTSLRTTGNFNGIIGQGDYSTPGGMSFQLEISAAASPALTFSASTGSNATTWSTTQDSTGGPVVTANTGWWLVAACVRHVSNTLAVQYYAYRFNTGTLTTAAGTTLTFAAATTQLAPPAATAITAVAAEGEITVTDWFPGGFGWCGVWNADLSATQNANPPAIWEAIAHGPLALADSTLAGLWILDNGDAHDYSTGAHNGTYVGSPTFVGTPVNSYPPVAAYRTTAVAGGVAPQALVGSASSVSAASGALTQTPAAAQNLVGAASSASAAAAAITEAAQAAQALVGSASSASTAAATLTETPQGAQSLVGTAASASSASGAFTSGTTALNLVGTASSASAASATLTETAQGAQAFVGSASSVSAASAALTETPSSATQALVGSAKSASSASGALTNGAAEVANFQIGTNNAGTGGNDMAPAAVRDSSNRLWRAAFTFAAFSNSGGANSGNTLRMFRCNTTGVPSAFTEQDSAHRPTNVGSFSMAIDGADLIHVAYVATYAATTTGIYYVTFNTGTNLWGTPVKIGTVNYAATTDYTVGDAGVCVALDSSGVPHVVHYGQTSGTGATHIFYTNKTSGSWSAALQLDGAALGTNQRCMHPQCMFDSTGALHVVWMTITFNYGTTLEKCYYVKRSSGGSFGSVTTFAENLLGSIDNGPSVYVSEDDHVHVAYGLGDGANPVSQAVTGATVNNSVFYRFSADGGATWNTTTQPAHYVSHDFSLGPSGDDAGGVRIYCHVQPTTVDGLGTAIGYMQLPKGGAWAAWTQTANDTNGNGYDCTVSPRREQFFHNGVKYLDCAYFDLNLPASAMLSSDPSGVVLTPMFGTASSASSASGALTQTPAAVQALVGAASSASAAAATITEASAPAQPLVGGARSASSANGALTETPAAAQPLTGVASSASAASAVLTQGTPAGVLVGTASSVSAASGALTQTPQPAQSLVGSASSTSGASAALTRVAPGAQQLVGAAASASAAVGALLQTGAGAQSLTGTASSASRASGVLSTGVAPVPIPTRLTGGDLALVVATAGDLPLVAMAETDLL